MERPVTTPGRGCSPARHAHQDVTITIDGYPVVSEDGMTLLDDQSQVSITIHDAAGAIVQQIPGAGAPPVTGTRMGVGAPGFPVAAATRLHNA